MKEIKLENVAAKDETEAALLGKVDKVTGKGLSTEDFTTLLKAKLEGIDTSLYATVSELAQKVATADIVDNLTIGGTTVPLSAEQGKVLKGYIDGINTLLQSNDIDLDTVQELVDAIKSIELSLATILVNDLTTGGVTKALTAEQGKVLKGLVDSAVAGQVALGETSTTAYRGDRGKTAYDHSQVAGNPHNTAIADIAGLASALAALQPLLVSGTNIKTINGTTLLGSGNIVVGASYGKFGISDSNGQYTYYSTLTLAMASALSGQTIEFFANYTETSNVVVTLKDNVNINGNGYTYTCTNNTANLTLFYAPTGSRTISNLTLVGSGIASTCTGFRVDSGNTTCFNFVVKMDAGYGAITYVGGIIDGITCKVTGNAVGISLNGGYVVNSRSYSANNGAIICSLSNGSIYNCHGESTGGVGIYGGYMRKCVGIGSTAGIQLQGGGGATDCTGISSAGYGIYISGSSTIHSNLVAISSSSWALRVYAPGIVINGFTAYALASYGFVGFSDTIASNGYTESLANLPFIADGGTYNNIYSKCSWNNASGHAFYTSGTAAELISCTLQVTNASANCINSASAKTVKFIDCKYKGATTPVNANITQGQSNSKDSQGNIKVN